MALVELFLALCLVSGTSAFAIYKMVNRVSRSAWFIRRIQNRNRKLLDSQALFRCAEHDKTFTKDQLVRYGDGEYCPNCYRDYVVKDRAQRGVVTDLGALRSEIFNTNKH